MRLDILLFAAVLFAFCNTSSTGSISTTVRSLTSKQEDVAAYGVGVETTKEERALNFSDFGNIFNAIVSKLTGKSRLTILKMRGKDDMEAYEYLGLDRKDSNPIPNERYNVWLNHLAKKGTQTRKSENNEPEKEKILLNLLAEFRNDKSRAKLHEKVTSALIHSWETRHKSSRDIFKQLKLHEKPTSSHSVNVDLLELWVRFVQRTSYSPIDEMVYTITDLKADTSMMILDSLKHNEATNKIGNDIEEKILSSWEGKRQSVTEVFKILNLDKDYDEACFNMWIKYVVENCDNLHTKLEEITALSKTVGDTGLLKVVLALIDYDYGKKLQVELMEMLMKSWKTNEKTLEEVLKMLDSTKDSVIGSRPVKLFDILKEHVKSRYKQT